MYPKQIRRWRAHRQSVKSLRQRTEKIESLLAGRSRESVLKEAPFSYGRWPDGDDLYLIHDSTIDEIVKTASSPGEAEMWILETYLTKT